MPRFNVLDLFCGCGGASVGFELASFQVVGAVDIDPVACETYSRNLGLEPMCADLRRVSGKEILRSFGLRKGEVDFLVGCPPCQGFSSLRRTTVTSEKEFEQDDRNDLIGVFAERVHEIQPKAVLFENVPGVAATHRGKFLDFYWCKMHALGYESVYDTVEAADYGVPQHRKRLIVFSIKTKEDGLIFPRPSHAGVGKAEERNLRKPWATVRGRIADLPPLKSGEAHPTIPNHTAKKNSPKVLKLIRSIPKDGGSRKVLPRNLWLECHKRLENGGAESIYGRMWWDRPAPTITSRCTSPSSGRFLHPEQDRAITLREAARLQTFPDEFVFPRIFSKAEWLIGNAVPPNLISNLATQFVEDQRQLL